MNLACRGEDFITVSLTSFVPMILRVTIHVAHEFIIGLSTFSP